VILPSIVACLQVVAGFAVGTHADEGRGVQRLVQASVTATVETVMVAAVARRGWDLCRVGQAGERGFGADPAG
jgi:hypothetical protein